MSGLCCAKREKKKNLQYKPCYTLLTKQKRKKNDGQFAFLT